jgi:LysM repeat protein
MNNPSPLIPQGSLLEQKNKSRARVKVAFFCVVGVHVAAILAALLAQGCKREPVVVAPETNASPVMETNVPVLNTNPAPPEVVASNPAPITPIAPPPEVFPAPGAQEYAIKKGDTFSSIAKEFHVTIKAIQAANPTVNPAKLQIGKKIAIPAPTASTVAPPATGVMPSPADAGEQIYVVKGGDTLTKIAHDHHTSPASLRKLNKLTTDKIKVGDKLKIPARGAAAPAAEPATGAPPR